MSKRLRVKDDPIRKHYWLRIKERRIIANLSQEELGRRARMHKLSIKHYESGKVEPSLQALVQLVVGLGLTGLDEIVRIDQESVRKVIADDVAARALATAAAAAVPAIQPKPAPSPLPPPAVVEAEPMIGAAAAKPDVFVNPVGDIMAKQAEEQAK